MNEPTQGPRGTGNIPSSQRPTAFGHGIMHQGRVTREDIGKMMKARKKKGRKKKK